MNLKILGSSSHGNCYILRAGNETLLLDCGVPFKEIQKALGFDLSSVVGCLATHEHQDHTKAVKDLMAAGIDCYMSLGTAEAIGLSGHRQRLVKGMDFFNVGPFTVQAFNTQHDAKEPLGFYMIYWPTEEKLLYLTDSFYVKERFSGVNYILIECNYCLDILKSNVEAGLINEALKNRILSSHFSLEGVKTFLEANASTDTRKIVLIHLSDANSDANRMQREVKEATGIETVVADAGMEIEMSLYPY